MKIAVGCDHGGFEHKNAIVEHLKAEGFEVEDFGIYENKSVDYPEIALKVANSIKNGENELKITLLSGNRNLLGPHHKPQGEIYSVGPSTFTDKHGWADDTSKPAWTDDYSFVRFGAEI